MELTLLVLPYHQANLVKILKCAGFPHEIGQTTLPSQEGIAQQVTLSKGVSLQCPSYFVKI